MILILELVQASSLTAQSKTQSNLPVGSFMSLPNSRFGHGGTETLGLRCSSLFGSIKQYTMIYYWVVYWNVLSYSFLGGIR